jgi:hypothetical protein
MKGLIGGVQSDRLGQVFVGAALAAIEGVGLVPAPFVVVLCNDRG